jgi:hypothetical protein
LAASSFSTLANAAVDLTSYLFNFGSDRQIGFLFPRFIREQRREALELQYMQLYFSYDFNEVHCEKCNSRNWPPTTEVNAEASLTRHE